ncbi:MAG: zinc-ribbon domain-containing protein [Nitrospirota bacterium]
MVLTCTACSAKLSIPDGKIPKTGSVTVACPKCQQKIQVAAKRVPVAPAPEVSKGPGPEDAVGAASDPVAEPRRLAMVCVDQLHGQMRVKTALAELGYTVHIVNDPKEAIDRLWQQPYGLVILHEEYGGAADNNGVLKILQPMPMSIRRFMYVGLIGKQYRTFDQATAFAKSVNFVVAETELSNLKAIVQEAVSDHDRFYRVFREVLREAGKL